MDTETALVNMPFFGTNRPSLALGLLKAELAQRDIRARVHYLNLAFAAQLGHRSYLQVGDLPSTLLAGEWLFSAALWGPDPVQDSAYLEHLTRHLATNRDHVDVGVSPEQWSRFLLECRGQVEPFLDRCLADLPWQRYRIVGFSSVFQQQVPSLALARRLKQRYPHLYLVFGGANCEAEMGAALFRSFPFIDAVCTGEGDLAFPELVEGLLRGRGVRDIPGLLLRSDEPRAASPGTPPDAGQTPAAPRVLDLDALPYPDFDDFFADRSGLGLLDEQIHLTFETSRGCWWGEKQQCTFCGLNGTGTRFRAKSPQRAIDEVRWLAERYGRYSGSFEAADNVIPMSYFTTFLPATSQHGLGVQLFYETKANLRREQVEALNRAGVLTIQPGIESLSTPVLKRMRKGTTRLQNIQLLKWCLEYSITPNWNYLIGFPGETDSDYSGQEDLIQSLTHFWPPAVPQVARVRFDRFSLYTTRPEDFGIRHLEPYPAYQLVYRGLDPAAVRGLAYFFQARFDGQDRVGVREERLTAALRGWHAVHTQAALFSVEAGETLLIYDARPPGPEDLSLLTGPWRTLYSMCDHVRGKGALLKAAAELLPGAEDLESRLEEFLSRLVGKKLLLEEGGQYLALAVPMSPHFQPPPSLLRRCAERLEALRTVGMPAGDSAVG
jgi:ribosomal peptide maturation radical SAM protein 1